MVDLLNRQALVCGSTQGIGRACAVELARRGAGVTLLARAPDRLKAVCAELPTPAGQTHRVISADFSQPEVVWQRVGDHVAAHGPHEILINNTGGPPGGPITDATPEVFQAAFANHLVCNQLLVQLLLPGMRAARFGRIVNIISTSVKQPIPGLGVSNTIRGAVASWAKTLAGEVAADGITVNNVLPGFTDTARLHGLIAARAERSGRSEQEVRDDMTATIPAGRFAQPEEIAAAAVFLASPAAAYITGVSLPVDGGRLQCL